MKKIDCVKKQRIKWANVRIRADVLDKVREAHDKNKCSLHDFIESLILRGLD